MLQAMQQPATASPSPGPPTFAGLLAALAAPAQKRPPVWSDDDLADDVATFSYERALRSQTRHRVPEFNDRSLTQRADTGSLRIFEALPDDYESAAQCPTRQSSAPLRAQEEPEASPENSAAHDRNLKSASITIRLSKTECDQLRQRAAEAGLTISAYLRSCTFEAESLRAMVKDTLAQLRSEPSKEDQDATSPAKGSWFGRWRRRSRHAPAGRHVAQA
jgi:predicted DNA binding CopG/RHH family protein